MVRNVTSPQSVLLEETFYCEGEKNDRRDRLLKFSELCSAEAAIAPAVSMSIIREVSETWNKDEPHLPGQRAQGGSNC